MDRMYVFPVIPVIKTISFVHFTTGPSFTPEVSPLVLEVGDCQFVS